MDNQKRTENAIDRAEAMTKMLAENVKSDEEDIYIKVSAVVQLLRELPSVNPQPCEDAISRQAALGCCRNEWEEEVEIRLKSLPPVTPQQSCEDIAKAFQLGMALGFAKKHDEMDKVMEEVKKAVTSQPKTGHWINLGVQGEINGQIVKGFTCSKCGAISVFRMTGRKIVNGDLCPNCGAKMSES